MKKCLEICLLTVACLIATTATATAWDFSCSPRDTTEIIATTPNVLLMLDRSGSMDDNDGRVAKSCKVCEGPSGLFEVDNAADCIGSPGRPVYHGTQQWANPCGEADKWEQAVDAIDALTFESDAATPEVGRFGLGLYHGTNSSIAEECQSTNHSDIMGILGPYETGTSCPSSSTCPGGNTPTARAIRTARNSTCVSGAGSRPTATILVNDGHPTRDINGTDGGGNNYRDAVAQACLHRGEAPLYIVGLGAGTDEDFNNILAAAGGTGSCERAGAEVDPCDNINGWASFRNECEGSIQANNGDALLTALSEITAALACTFPVDFTGSGVSEVPEDPTGEYEYLYVDGYKVASGGNERITYKDSSLATPTGEGWEFTGVPRQYVRFTPHYCDAVRRTEYSRVSTQLACLCQEETGTRCEVDNWEALGVCPEGTWQCTEGTDWCEPDAECCIPGPCDTGLPGICGPGELICDGTSTDGVCTQTVFPEEEICDGIDNDCDGEIDEGIGGDCSVPGGLGRCEPGRIECIDGAEVCTALYDPMPELCNGLDDDCDGDVDNISQSWRRSEFSGYTAAGGDAGKACRFISVCACPNGTDDHAGDNFGQYMAEWDPICQCGEGLEPPDDDSTSPDPASETAPLASCAAAGGADAAPGWLLLVAGMLLLGRRRD